MKGRNLPGRISSGVYILHSGLEKWNADDQRAAGVHGMAARAFPFLARIPPARFVRLLSAAEIATGVALLIPVVPEGVAGAALTAFSGGLVAMYLRTPSLHRPGSVWPTPAGTGISKDVWLLGIGLDLLVDEVVAGG